MLRRKSAPLMELIRIADDTETDANMVAHSEALHSVTTIPTPPRPSSARITAPISFLDYVSLHPHQVAPGHGYPPAQSIMQRERRHHRRRSRSRSRSCVPEDLDSNPDRFDEPPIFHDDGTAESRKPRYAWPYWYEWTASGIVRGRCSP